MAFNPKNLLDQAVSKAEGALKDEAESTVQKFLGSAGNFGSSLVTNFVNDITDSVGAVFEPFNFAKKLRGQNLPSEDSPEKRAASAEFSSSTEADWRVRLSVPSTMSGSDLLAPLGNTQNSMTFPLTPSVIISHSANYNSL